jgi:hypothetical protein
MTKFEELSEAFTKARNLFKQYEDDCKVLAREIWDKMISFYGIPLGEIALYNIDSYGAPDKISGFDYLLMALREDGYFEFGIGLTLFELPQKYPYPHYTIVLPVDISIDKDGKYKARYGEDGKVFIIDRKVEASYEKFLDEMFMIIKSEYDEGLSNMRLQNTFRSIGFKNKEES